MNILLSLAVKNLIIESLDNKKHKLKRFECNKCGQIYIYVVDDRTKEINCSICSTTMKSERELIK